MVKKILILLLFPTILFSQEYPMVLKTKFYAGAIFGLHGITIDSITTDAGIFHVWSGAYEIMPNVPEVDSSWVSIDVDYMDFNITEEPEAQERRLYWNDDKKTLSLDVGGGSHLDFGQENSFPVINLTGSTIENGTIVYLIPHNSSVYRVGVADKDNYLAYFAIGMTTTTITHGSTGRVCSFGDVDGLNTDGHEGELIWLGDNGAFVYDMPTTGARINIGAVKQGHSSEGVISIYRTLHSIRDFAILNDNGTSGIYIYPNYIQGDSAKFNTIMLNSVDIQNVLDSKLNASDTNYFTWDFDYNDLFNTPYIPVSGTDFDPVGTDNSTNVTLSGSYDYLTLSGQEITLNKIDYSTDISNTPTIPTLTSELTNDSGYLTSEVDGSTTNEIQTLTYDGSTLSISSGNSVEITSGTTIELADTFTFSGFTSSADTIDFFVKSQTYWLDRFKMLSTCNYTLGVSTDTVKAYIETKTGNYPLFMIEDLVFEGDWTTYRTDGVKTWDTMTDSTRLYLVVPVNYFSSGSGNLQIITEYSK